MPNSNDVKFTNMRVHPDSVDKLKEGEAIYKRKNMVKPNHSEAVKMAVAAWIRELKAA